MPREVRERLEIDLDQPDAVRDLPWKATLAFRALAKHYGVDVDAPWPWPASVWEKMFYALAADFLPAFYWRRGAKARKPGRPREGDLGRARQQLLVARRKVKIRADASACAYLAKRWKAHPSENPFRHTLRASSLRSHLAIAKTVERQALAAALTMDEAWFPSASSAAAVGGRRSRGGWIDDLVQRLCPPRCFRARCPCRGRSAGSVRWPPCEEMARAFPRRKGVVATSPLMRAARAPSI